MLKRAYGRPLDGLELARIVIVFNRGEGLYDPLVPATNAIPIRSYCRIRKRMDLDTDSLAPGIPRKERGLPLYATQRKPRPDDHDAVFQRELDHVFLKRFVRLAPVGLFG